MGKGKNTFSHSSIQEYGKEKGRRREGDHVGRGRRKENRDRDRDRGGGCKGSYLFRGETLQGAPS